jgi:hypothetical protein
MDPIGSQLDLLHLVANQAPAIPSGGALAGLIGEGYIRALRVPPSPAVILELTAAGRDALLQSAP